VESSPSTTDGSVPSLSEERGVVDEKSASMSEDSDGLSSILDELDRDEKSRPQDFWYPSTDSEVPAQPPVDRRRRLSAYEYAAAVYGDSRYGSPKPWFSRVFGVSPAKFRKKAKDLSVFDRALTLYVRMNWVLYTQLGLGWAGIPGSRAPFPCSLRLHPSPRITGWELAGALRSTAKRFKRSPLSRSL
jgi:hypothetical protein